MPELCKTFLVGEPGAVEMTWMQVPGEKLLEPVVNLVINLLCFFVVSHSLICLIQMFIIVFGERSPGIGGV